MIKLKNTKTFKISICLVLIFIISIIYYVYQLLMYPTNNYQGFCIPEMRQLSNEEKLQRVRGDRIVWELVGWDDLYERRQVDGIIYISKYDLTDHEAIIKLMQKADINKSFADNFGVVAQADIEEHASKRRCLELEKEINRKCNFDSTKYIAPHIKNLYTQNNEIDIEYINSIPENYSFMIESNDNVRIFPISQIKILDNNNTHEAEQMSISKLCCDNQAIFEKFQSTNNTTSSTMRPVFAEGQPDLTIDDIDGKKINSSYISDLYRFRYFANMEQVQQYGLFENVANLRYDKQLMRRGYQVSACGNYIRKRVSIYDNQ